MVKSYFDIIPPPMSRDVNGYIVKDLDNVM